MSVEHSNSHSFASTVSGSKRKGGKPPFKLCFSKQLEIGRSRACMSKSKGNFIAPKFYSKEVESIRNTDVSQTVKELEKEEYKSPKDLYRWPLLTSHTYGWWSDKGILLPDSRFNFHRKTSDLVNCRMRIYAEDRKLKGYG